ncbi:MAG TPA: hypothetical protein VHE14_05200, partial [Solirubrobacteraceae bacterium]|nr:hypothetical protein [Solirubrobacteraceae bacterium]
FRIEIPFTRNHWEAAYVARENPIARGWERQLDVRYNHLFYRPRLTAARYESWLATNGVAYVALPDSKLDFSAVAEARLLRAGIAGLRPSWSSRHWRVWKVVASRPLASPSPLTTLGREGFTLRSAAPGATTVRERFTPYWAITSGAGCVERAPGGWTKVTASRAGDIAVGIRFGLGRVFEHGRRCAG